MPSLAVLIPMRDRIPSKAFTPLVSAIMNAEKFWQRTHGDGQGFNLFTKPDAQAAEARHDLWRHSEAAGADWLLWFDDDTAPPPDALERLWPGTAMAPIVTGFYWRKGPPFISTVGRQVKGATVGAENGIQWIDPDDMVMPYEYVDFMGAGCLLMQKKVVDHVALAFGNNPFFTRPGLTEDVYFTNSAASLGYKMVAARDCQCLHVGDYAFGYEDRKRAVAANPELKKLIVPCTKDGV